MIPAIIGTIDRRILINYQVLPEVIERFLPHPFKPKLVNGKAIAGICLIRLMDVRPKLFPLNVGISSENAAHRIAVEWTENGVTREGVYIPRRDTSSKLNSLAGGRIFPGIHHLSNFTIYERDGYYSIEFKSDDKTFLSIKAQENAEWNKESVFGSLECASCFFENGAIGYSPNKIGDAFDGLELKTAEWKVVPLSVTAVHSSFFEDENIFPEGSVKFDNALLMKGIRHEWRGLKKIRG